MLVVGVDAACDRESRCSTVSPSKEKTEEQYLLPGLMTQRNCDRFTLDSKILMVQLAPSQWSAVRAVITKPSSNAKLLDIDTII